MTEFGTFHVASLQSAARGAPDAPAVVVLTSADPDRPNRVELTVHDRARLAGLSHGSAVKLHLEPTADPHAEKPEAKPAAVKAS